jgi:hypothetical protein
MIGPLLLIVIGILFLLNNLYPAVFRFGKMWPVILIAIGTAKVIEYFQGRKSENRKEDPR